MNTNINLLYTIGLGVILLSGFAIFLKVCKDKKINNNEKKELEITIIECLNKAITITELKTQDEIKAYCVLLVQEQLKKNNIQGVDEKTIKTMLDLTLKINQDLNAKINSKKTK